MTQQFDSKAERAAAPFITALGGKRCDDFAPLLSRTYLDYSGEEHSGKPDFLIRRGAQFTFIEIKAGKLHGHYTKAKSHEAIGQEYLYFHHRVPDGLSHSFMCNALYKHRNRFAQLAVLEHSWNQSLFKVASIQAKHGWQRYLVVFEKNPTKKDAERYHRAGLIWCTVKTLYDLMNTIELAQYGWIVPYVFCGRGYSFTLTPELGSGNLEQAEAIDRSRFIAGVQADQQSVEDANIPRFEDSAPF